MQVIADQIKNIESAIAELRDSLPDFESQAAGAQGSKKYRSITRRIVLSSQTLEELVKENTFSK